jgi:hypothetical protein
MNLVRKIIAYCLLLAFVAVLIPWPILHNTLADHTTEQDTHCREFHNQMGTHIEAGHAHCSIFDSTTLLYTKAKFFADINIILQLNAVYNTATKASVSKAVAINLPSRAPPAC